VPLEELVLCCEAESEAAGAAGLALALAGCTDHGMPGA
jgi:hypothetical protein